MNAPFTEPPATLHAGLSESGTRYESPRSKGTGRAARSALPDGQTSARILHRPQGPTRRESAGSARVALIRRSRPFIAPTRGGATSRRATSRSHASGSESPASESESDLRLLIGATPSLGSPNFSATARGPALGIASKGSRRRFGSKQPIGHGQPVFRHLAGFPTRRPDATAPLQRPKMISGHPVARRGEAAPSSRSAPPPFLSPRRGEVVSGPPGVDFRRAAFHGGSSGPAGNRFRGSGRGFSIPRSMGGALTLAVL